MSDLNESDPYDIVVRIIERSRLACGLPTLNERNLAATADAWLELLRGIPGERLEECYLRTMRERTIRTALQPTELLQTWRTIAGIEQGRRENPFTDDDFKPRLYKCRYCSDQGYQHVRVRRGLGYTVVQARPCVCEAAPISQQSKAPLAEPEWTRLRNGEWERRV